MIMPGPKMSNRRVYPDATRQPRNFDALRKSSALERQADYDKLTLQQKLERLPPEPHCQKQRAKLLAMLEKQQKKTVVVETEVSKTETVEKKLKNK